MFAFITNTYYNRLDKNSIIEKKASEIMIIKRDYYLNELIKKLHNKRIKVITGLRRVGKSFLLKTLFYNYLIKEGVKKEQIHIVNLDELSMIKYRNPFFLMEYLNERLLKNKMNYIFIDEIQFVERIKNPYLNDSYVGFYEVLNELLNKENVDIYVTGSNSKMLSSDILTEFRGKGDNIHIMPLSIKELFQYYDKDFNNLYKDYQVYGGLPYLVNLSSDEEKIKYLKDLVNETYLKDIIERNNIVKTEEITILTSVLASTIGSYTNRSKLSNTFKSNLGTIYGKETIKSHIEHLNEAFLISEVSRYDIKGRKYIGANSKFYFSDIGIRNAILNFRQLEPTHLMENIIYNHLIMHKYNVDVGIVEVNAKENGKYIKKQLEVDFIISKGNVKIYIQSAYNIDSLTKIKQEKKSLINIDDSFKKIIIVRDNFKPWYDDNGILMLSLKDFLLDVEIINRV